ncbi:MAG: acetyltransferase [Prevotella sp.]|nr:acetyltransferase [Prevotella sp.]
MTKENIGKLSSGRTVRQASLADLPIVMELIRQGREKMIAAGNPNQWSAARPSQAQVSHDIALGGSYLLCEDGHVIATFAFLPGPDPTYARIDGGGWLNGEPYHVIHRVASVEGVHGVMADIIAYCAARTGSVRIDTHADNRPMQAALARLGFAYCGIIYLENGESRLAYQLITAG